MITVPDIKIAWTIVGKDAQLVVDTQDGAPEPIELEIGK